MSHPVAALLTFPLTLGQAAAPADHSLPPASAAPPVTGAGQPLVPSAAGDPAAVAQKPQGLGGFLLPLALMMGVVMLFTMGSGRKEKKKRAELLSQLAKGARVQTVGGIKGTVIDVREADDEVVVKVDEKSNTSLRFARSSITSVMQDS
ncbi:MAG: preprotein translocase subunit YajC [Algisphaera sp.]